VSSTHPASRVIAIATSAGGLVALSRLLGSLPPAIEAGVVVVQHLQPDRPSRLAEILGWHTGLEVKEAAAGEILRSGTVYVSPPDVHLMVTIDGRLVLSHLPPLNFCRPSGDRLFASIAASYGARAIAVVLTGTGCDAAAGASEVRRLGGTVIAQDEATSAFFGMPWAAIKAGAVDRVLPLAEIAGALEGLVEAGSAA
jgi:two-component system, chemotaxis family, protein-glutamate methylesterase/glutaminase